MIALLATVDISAKYVVLMSQFSGRTFYLTFFESMATVGFHWLEVFPSATLQNGFID